MHKVALAIISCGVSAWVFGKALPAHNARMAAGHGPKEHTNHDKSFRKKKHAEEVEETREHLDHPASPIWRACPNAYSVAVVGTACLRLESLAILFKAVKKQQPPLMAAAERAELAERIRQNGLSEQVIAQSRVAQIFCEFASRRVPTVWAVRTVWILTVGAGTVGRRGGGTQSSGADASAMSVLSCWSHANSANVLTLGWAGRRKRKHGRRRGPLVACNNSWVVAACSKRVTQMLIPPN